MVATASTDEVIYLDKGRSAPFSGVLMPDKVARDLRSELLEKDKLEILHKTEQFKNENLNKIITLKDSEIELYRKQNERLVKLKDNNNTINYVWFGLGVLVTGLAVYGAGSLAK